MAANSMWPGVVKNLSSQPVWVLWDEGEDEAHKQWFGKPLAAGRRSPKGLDIDGVCAYGDGMRIASLTRLGGIDVATADWWWLGRGAEVTIRDRKGSAGLQTIFQTSFIGSLKIVKDSEVSGWGVYWHIDLDTSWGIQL